MPLNEAEGYSHSTLTENQQQEAMESLYGLERDPMSPDPLSNDEIDRMRQIIAQHDAKTAQTAMKEFDLNKPSSGPYVYREFPFLLYDHQAGKTKAARNHEERQQMLADGWSESPCATEMPEIPLTPAEHAEADRIDAKLEKRRK